jgi:hypothetical protein
MQNLHFKLPDVPDTGVGFNTILLDVYWNTHKIGSIVQTKQNLPDGASADRFYLANPKGIEVKRTDSYTLAACLRKTEDCLLSLNSAKTHGSSSRARCVFS